MRKTHDPQALHTIYSKKYANWIIPYLKEYGVDQAPPMLCFNTLYQLPDYYSVGSKNFFLVDFYLYDFLYDLNFCLKNAESEEYLLNLYIKTYAEKALLNDRYMMCYFLCASSPELEYYKLSTQYRNKSVMQELADETDIQEAFTFLHEATHSLVGQFSSIRETSINKTLVSIFSTMPGETLDEEFYEECYCDYLSIVYILKKTYFSTEITHSKYFSLIFRTITGIYIIQLADMCQRVQKELIFTEQDKKMELFLLRFSVLYTAIYKFLIDNNRDEIPLIQQIQEKAIYEMKELSYSIREMSYHIETLFEENKTMVENIEKGEQIEYIYDYLNIYQDS